MKKMISVFAAAVMASAFVAEAAPVMNDGWSLLNSGKFQEAEKVFRTIASQPGQSYNGTIGTMFALRRQRKNDDVIKEVDAWVKNNPQATANQKTHLICFKGNALRDLGKIDEALAAYKAGFDLKGTNYTRTDCAKEYILTAGNCGKVALAMAMYEEAIKVPNADKNLGFLANSAWLMWKANKPDPGLELLKKAEALKLTDGWKETVYRYRGYLYRDGKKDYEAAVKAFEQALAVNGLTETQKAVLWNNIGMAYERDDEYEKAVEAFKKVGTFNAKGWFMKSAANAAVRLQKKIDAGE